MTRNQRIGTTAIVAAVVLAMAGFVAINLERLPDYRVHLDQNLPEVRIPYDKLSTDLNESALRKLFPGVFLTCYDVSPSQLGDHVCYTDISKADGLSALMVNFMFAEGKLTHVMVRVPWWTHGRWLDKLVAQYGKANRNGITSRFGGPILIWDLPGGSLEYNRNRSFNPLEWSMLFFTPGGAKRLEN